MPVGSIAGQLITMKYGKHDNNIDKFLSYNYINVAEGLNTQKTTCQPMTTPLPPHLGGHITLHYQTESQELGLISFYIVFVPATIMVTFTEERIFK